VLLAANDQHCWLTTLCLLHFQFILIQILARPHWQFLPVLSLTVRTTATAQWPCLSPAGPRRRCDYRVYYPSRLVAAVSKLLCLAIVLGSSMQEETGSKGFWTNRLAQWPQAVNNINWKCCAKRKVEMLLSQSVIPWITENLGFLSVPFSTVVVTDLERLPKVWNLWLVFASLKPLATIHYFMILSHVKLV
jgi:hypothetical protein